MPGGAGAGRGSPADLARRLGTRRDVQATRPDPPRAKGWRRETFALPRAEARLVASAWFERFPKAAFKTEIESWRERADGIVEFTMRRLAGED